MGVPSLEVPKARLGGCGQPGLDAGVLHLWLIQSFYDAHSYIMYPEGIFPQDNPVCSQKKPKGCSLLATWSLLLAAGDGKRFKLSSQRWSSAWDGLGFGGLSSRLGRSHFLISLKINGLPRLVTGFWVKNVLFCCLPRGTEPVMCP